MEKKSHNLEDSPDSPGPVLHSPTINVHSDFEFFSKEKINPIELYWENLFIYASFIEKKKCRPFSKTKKEKCIIKDVKGIARPGTFTAILGPSGLIMI